MNVASVHFEGLLLLITIVIIHEDSIFYACQNEGPTLKFVKVIEFAFELRIVFPLRSIVGLHNCKPNNLMSHSGGLLTKIFQDRRWQRLA